MAQSIHNNDHNDDDDHDEKETLKDIDLYSVRHLFALILMNYFLLIIFEVLTIIYYHLYKQIPNSRAR